MILKVARSMIAEKGYENVTLRAIARQADYSPAGLYEYFESKDDLMEMISEQVNAEMVEALNQIPETQFTAEKLLEMWIAYIHFGLDNKKFFTMMGSIPSRRKSLNEPALPGSAYQLFLGVVADLIRERGVPVASSSVAEEITYGLWATAQGMISLRLSYLKDFEADFEQVNRRVLRGVINSLLSEYGEVML